MNFDRKTIILISVATVALISLGMLLYSHFEMSDIIDVLNEEKTELISEYEDLYSDYDSLRTNNEDLNYRLELEQERIAQLKEELQTVKATNARRIKELQEELTTTRAVMRTFIRQVDSLNQLNIKLEKENKSYRSQVAKEKKSNQELSKRNEALTEQVTLASKLETQNISAVSLTQNEKKATSISKTSKIKINFDILKNQTAEVGLRDFYLRITRPDGQLLLHSKSDLFNYENTQLNYSAKRQIEYGGEQMTTYIVYIVDAGELLIGTYDVEIFSGGEKIGNGKFTLK